MIQNTKYKDRCSHNYTHIRIGYLKDCRISGLTKDSKQIRLLGRVLQALHICRFSEYDDHWCHQQTG